MARPETKGRRASTAEVLLHRVTLEAQHRDHKRAQLGTQGAASGVRSVQVTPEAQAAALAALRKAR